MSADLTAPADWRVAPIGDIVVTSQYGLSLASDSEGTTPIIGMKDLVDGKVTGQEWARVSLDEADLRRFRLNHGDILLNRTNSNDLVGKVAIWDRSDEAVFASYLVRFVIDAQSALPEYVNHYLNADDGQRRLRQLATRGVSQANINPTVFRQKFLIAIPPLPEQRRIAKVLDAWDEAIATTERLVAVKRVRSHGLMQRLVEGSDAPRAELDTFATLVSDKVDPTNFGGVSVELDNIESRTGRRLGTTTLQAGAGVRHRYVEGDVLFGKLRPYLAKYIYAEEDGLTSTEVWVLRADRTVCTPRYLYYLVQSQAFAAAANKPTGSRMPRAEWEIVRETPLPLPTIAEQERVVRVLACAEADASSEDVILDRLRLQKRGLMQKLLTGAWRVPESIEALMPDVARAEVVEAAE